MPQLPWALAGLLLSAGLLAYLNTLENAFVFDDTPHIIKREVVHDLGNVGDLLRDDQRPVWLFSLAVNYAIGGEDPVTYHLFNLAVHVLAALSLFGVVRRTLLLPLFEDRFADSANWLAFAAALLWLLHPLNTQAVTYVVQRGESMMGLCYLFTLYCFIRYATIDPITRWGWAALALISCAVGMGCKQVMVTAPIVVVLYDLTFNRPDRQTLLRSRLAIYAALASTWLLLGWLVGAAISAEQSSAGFGVEVISPFHYALSQFGVILHYLRLSFWPHPLILDYMWIPAIPIDTPREALPGRVLGAVVQAAVITSLVVASLWGLARRQWWGFCGICFFLVLAPTSSIMPIADLAVEHRMYLPLVAVVCVAVAAGYWLLGKLVAGRQPFVGSALVAVLAVGLGSATVIRNYEYVNAVSIWDTVAHRRPNNPRGLHNLGSALDKAGRPDDALVCYERTLRILPKYHAAHNGIGKIYLDDRGDPVRAVERFGTAVSLDPDDPEYRYNLAKALMLTGDAADLDLAEQQLLRAIDLRPHYAKAHSHLGLIKLARADLDQAIAQFRRSIEADPQFLDGYQNLAAALSDAGRHGDAADEAGRAADVARALDLPEEVEKFTGLREKYRPRQVGEQ